MFTQLKFQTVISKGDTTLEATKDSLLQDGITPIAYRDRHHSFLGSFRELLVVKFIKYGYA
jgi:hypothetical protein